MRVTVGPPTITINHDRGFLVCQPDGTFAADDEAGFFSRDTRFVSAYRVTLNGRPPVLLNAANVEHFSARHEYAALPAQPTGSFFGEVTPAPVAVERPIGFRLDRSIDEAVHEDYEIVNYGPVPTPIVLEVEIESDFADIFEVRAHHLARRGEIESVWDPRSTELRTRYRNRSFRRALVVKVDRPGTRPQFANGRLVFAFSLDPKATWHTCLGWLPVIGGHRGHLLACRSLTAAAAPDRDRAVLPPVMLDSGHPTLPAIWRQAVADMESLRISAFARSRSVYVPAAGIPWYVTLFGRDSLIVSMETISGFPEFAAGALEQLSSLQATNDNAEQDKEPGKIPHEIRFGELAELGLLPFAPYYGTADATPLYLIVLSYLYQWSGDRALLDRYRANAEAALRWLLESGDRDRDGYQEYGTRSTHGLFNQGWKDSGVAVLHADGSVPEPPIATCELQGYAYDALTRMAEMYELWAEPERADEMRRRAAELFERFNEDFWWEAEGTYYLGLDGQKRPIRSVASNAGHCLASGIVPPDRGGRVVDRLMAPDMFSGWGVRTLSSGHPGYGPHTYHNGSVWPHDNATLAGGFRRAGRPGEAQRIAEGIFAAAERFDSYRLPELFAGLAREPGSFPVQYLGANVPQAWAAASVFRLVAVLCGIHAQAARRTIFVDPALPSWLPSLTIRNLRAGSGAAVLTIGPDAVEVLENTTGYEIVRAPAPRPPQPAPR